MYGNSIPAANADGDLFEYINFEQRYNIDARIERANELSRRYLEPLPEGSEPQNAVELHTRWLQSRDDYTPAASVQYRQAKSSEQLRIAENLHELYTTAGVLLVDAQGHGSIAAKIASTVHDTFHTAMLGELDSNGKTTAHVFEIITSGSHSPLRQETRWAAMRKTIPARSQPWCTGRYVLTDCFAS